MSNVQVPEKSINIGQRLELFVDNCLIAEVKGRAEQWLHNPLPREAVIVHDKPWEGNTCAYHTVFRDGGIYRMYYRGANYAPGNGKKSHEPFTCYAESTDGIRWVQPSLGIVEFNGSKKNNIILEGIGTHNFAPFKDMNPNCSPDAQYKALGIGKEAQAKKLFAFKSLDGIHWSLMRDTPVITKGTFDSQNLAFWYPEREEYRCYFRDYRGGVRDIKSCTSKDFVNWTPPTWLEYPGAPKEHLYTNQIQPYYRAPHIFIGFPTRFIPSRESLTEGLFMTSRDGQRFHRWGEAIIRPTQNKDRWYNRSNYIWYGLVETRSSIPGAPNELSLYTNERYYRGPGVKIRRYTYRIDGFVSMHAPFSGGEFITKPLVFGSSKLVINFSTSAAGSVRVEIQEAGGKPIKGFALSDCPEIYGDEIEWVVQWKKMNNVSTLAGQPIRLRFFLRDADVYSFRFQ